jgi:DNA-binding PucR family transcriptional regulator
MQTTAQRAGIGTRAGVSAARSNLTVALPQAEVALALALAGASGAFVDYASLGPLRFVLDAPHTDEMSRIVLELLGPLAHHHDAKRAELLVTLEAYTAAGGHHTTTADSLHIHVSTLKYRLARIAEITGLRLAEPRTRFELTLAFQLRDVLARLGKDPLAVAD